MAVPRFGWILGFLAILTVGCVGGTEQKKETYALLVKVKHKKYDPIHTKVTRNVTPQVVKDRVLKLAGTNQVQREEALDDLVAMGRQQPKAIGLIVHVLDNKEPRVREYALLALAKIGPGDWRIPVDKFKKLIIDREDFVKCATMYAVGLLGVKDKNIVKKTFEYLSDPNPSLRSYAAECIRKLAYWPAIPALIYGHLARENLPIHIRGYAWEALENITLAKVTASPRGHNMFALLKARAIAWTQWWESNRHKYRG